MCRDLTRSFFHSFLRKTILDYIPSTIHVLYGWINFNFIIIWLPILEHAPPQKKGSEPIVYSVASCRFQACLSETISSYDLPINGGHPGPNTAICCRDRNSTILCHMVF